MSFFIRTFACMKKNISHTNLVTTIKALLHVVSLLSAPLLLTAAIFMAACSSDDANDTPTPTNDNAEIAFTANIWGMMGGTRATFFTTGDLTSGSFMASAYNANSTTAYINPTTVNYVIDKWVFDGDVKYYWPAESFLDFFAYMPVVPDSYITSGPTYTTARNPQFSCTLPMTHAGQASITEFVYDLKTGQNKANQGASGVMLNFQHPFARINLQLSSIQETIRINSITLKGIKKTGSFSHAANPQWTTSGEADNFVATLNADYSANDVIGNYIMIPQTFTGGKIVVEVNATWIDWGEPYDHTISTEVATEWQAGTSYTYTFTITKTDLTVDTSKYTEQW